MVGKTHLATRFLALIELLRGVFGIDHGEDGIDQVGLGNLIVHKKGLHHRAGVGQARGFNHDALKIDQPFAPLGRQQLQGFAQVFADGAADAAVAHLQDLFFGFGAQNIGVDVFFAKFIFNNSNLHAVGFAQDAFEQRGFACAQKARQDGGGDQSHKSTLPKIKPLSLRWHSGKMIANTALKSMILWKYSRKTFKSKRSQLFKKY